MKKNQNNLLAMSFLYSFGSAMVGVFFPFLVANAFGFEIWELMLWLFLSNFAGFCIVYPLNSYLEKRFSIQNNLQIGLLFLALFYLSISISRNSVFLVNIAAVFFTLGNYIFWPNYHLLNLQSTKDGARGNYIGNIQAMLVSANILAPLISGFLLQKNLDSYISIVAAISFGLSIYFSQKLSPPKYSLQNFAGICSFFKQKFLPKKIFRMSIIQGIQGGVLFAIWPIFLKSVLIGFTQMGIFLSFGSAIEIISAKISGKITDKNSAKKTLKYSAIARFFDLGIRSLLFFFPTALMAGIASFFAGFLGPIFNISLYGRIIEIAEETPDRIFDFFIVREWALCLCRCLVFLIAAIFSFYFGVSSFAVLIFIAALASFGLRKT